MTSSAVETPALPDAFARRLDTSDVEIYHDPPLGSRRWWLLESWRSDLPDKSTRYIILSAERYRLHWLKIT